MRRAAVCLLGWLAGAMAAGAGGDAGAAMAACGCSGSGRPLDPCGPSPLPQEAQAQGASSAVIRGIVRGAAVGREVVGSSAGEASDLVEVEVQFAFHAGGGVPGCLVTRREVTVLTTTCAGDGKFRLEIPAGVHGTLLAHGNGRVTPPRLAAAGDLVVLELPAAPLPMHDVRLIDVEPGARCEAHYAGEGPLPPLVLTVDARGHVEVPQRLGYEACLVLPRGTCSASGEVAVPLAGTAFDVRLERAVVRDLADTWVQPLRGGTAGSVAWGGAAALWVGQDAGGAAFLCRGDGVRVGGAGSGGISAELPAGGGVAVVVQSTPLELEDHYVQAVVAHRRALAAGRAGAVQATWERLREDQPWMLLVQESGDRAPWVLAAGGSRVARVGIGTRVRVSAFAGAVGLHGTVREADGTPLAGAVVHVRPLACRGAAPGGMLPGVVTRTGLGGRFTLPCRLAEGTYDVLVRTCDARFELRTVTVAAAAGAAATLEVRMLAHAGGVDGMIEGPNGSPAAGVLVHVLSGREPPWLAGFGGLPGARTDAAGRFALRGLARGVPHEVFCDSSTRGGALVDNVRADGPPLVLRLQR